MKPSHEIEAMRALSDLYRIEAERNDSTSAPDIAELKAVLKTVPLSSKAADCELFAMSHRKSSNAGVSQETAWKILIVTFAAAGLIGVFAALFSKGAPPQNQPPLEPLALPESHFIPDMQHFSKPVEPSTNAGLKSSARKKTVGRGSKATKQIEGKRKEDKEKKDAFEFFNKCGMDPMCGFDQNGR